MNIRFIALAGLALASTALAGPINTGAAGVNWTVSFNGGSFTTAQIETGILPVQPGFAGGWVANGSGNNGVWIGKTAGGGNYGPGEGSTVGVYVYQLALAGLGTGNLTAQYAADNNIVWSLTGGGTITGGAACGVTNGSGNDQDNCYSTLRTLTATGITTTSVLTATVRNGPQGGTLPNPSGLIVQGSNITDVPEPSTYTMLALGGLAVAMAKVGRK